MAQKLECDRCATLTEGVLTHKDGRASIHVHGAAGDGGWAIVSAPYHKGVSTSPPAKLLCAGCVGELHDFLKPLPAPPSKARL